MILDTAKSLIAACPDYNIDPHHWYDCTCEYLPDHCGNNRQRAKIPDLEILRTNHQIYTEAIEVFQKENVFTFPTTDDATAKVLREGTFRRVSRIKAAFEDSPYRQTKKLLPRLISFLESRPPLKCVELELRGNSWDENEVRNLFSEIGVGKLSIEVVRFDYSFLAYGRGFGN